MAFAFDAKFLGELNLSCIVNGNAQTNKGGVERNLHLLKFLNQQFCRFAN